MDFFEAHLEAMPPHRAILRAVECKLMSQVPLRHPVLDVGAGDGHFAWVAYGECIEAGVDVRLGDLAEAVARPGVYGGVAAASATALPFANQTFGTVVSNCVIEHIPDLEAALAEIGRVLQPGGLFATTVPTEHFTEYLLGSSLFGSLYGRFFNRIARHHHIYTLETWRGLLKERGLELVEARDYFSKAATRAFDLSHYLGVPNLLARLATGKWVLHRAQMAPFRRWLRRYYDEPWPPQGACRFLLARKA